MFCNLLDQKILFHQILDQNDFLGKSHYSHLEVKWSFIKWNIFPFYLLVKGNVIYSNRTVSQQYMSITKHMLDWQYKSDDFYKYWWSNYLYPVENCFTCLFIHLMLLCSPMLGQPCNFEWQTSFPGDLSLIKCFPFSPYSWF